MMENYLDEVEQALASWRAGKASLADVRSLPTKVGRRGSTSDIPAVMELLGHIDPIVRYNAAMSLAFKFGYKPVVEPLLAMLRDDQDADCRDVAAAGVCSLCRNSRDRDVLAALARAAEGDPDEDVRNSAYKALVCVNGISDEQYLQLLEGTYLPTNLDRVKEIVNQTGNTKPA